jgi:NADPH-dependent curcumin reductase CurA
MTTKNHEVHLKRRPVGMPVEGDFEVVEASMPEPADGEFVVRNIWMTVDPYMRGRMTERKSYVPPFQIGEVLDGGSVGQVVKSRNSAYAEGDYVCGFASGGWREYNVTAGGMMFNKVDPTLAPLECYLGVLGMPGLTAYTSLLKIGEPKEGETIFVSAAAGAVGSVVSQIAKIKGLRVVGSAGSAEKCKWVKEVAGADECVNYKSGSLLDTVSKACPKGIDIYYENVGGEHLETALELMNSKGRLVMCGMISMYNATEAPPGPRNLVNVIGRSLKMQGFIVSDYIDMVPQFYMEMGPWIGEGKIRWQQTVMEGIGAAPKAFIGLFRGDNSGKMLVRLGPDKL